MQEKIDGIKKINESMWIAYKKFLSEKDKERYQKSVTYLEWGYDGDLKWFCRNLASAWGNVVELCEVYFEKGINVSEIHSCVSDIQNSVWLIYRGFVKNHVMPECTRKFAELTNRYKDDKDMMLFAQTLILSWVPIINNLEKEFKKERFDDVHDG